MFLPIDFSEAEEKRFQLFHPKGEFWNRLEGALDLSKKLGKSETGSTID